MRLLRLASLLCLLALLLVAFASVTSAHAEEPEGEDEAKSPVAGTTFTFTSGASEFVDPTSGFVLKCKTDKSTKGAGEKNEWLDSKKLQLSIVFEKCTIGGLAAQSLGDKVGIVLITNVIGELCYINKAAKDVGLLITLPSEGVHIEVPSIGELLVIKGSVVGLIAPLNKFEKGFTLTFPAAPMGPYKCEKAAGSEDVLLLELEHSGKTLVVEEISTESITMAEPVRITG